MAEASNFLSGSAPLDEPKEGVTGLRSKNFTNYLDNMSRTLTFFDLENSWRVGGLERDCSSTSPVLVFQKLSRLNKMKAYI